MQERDACPDLGRPKAPGLGLHIEGSQESFDVCPAAFLRTETDVVFLRGRFKEPYAEHLIEGREHPAIEVGQVAFEIESGARSVESLSPKMRDAVHLWRRETRARDDYAHDKRRKERKS